MFSTRRMPTRLLAKLYHTHHSEPYEKQLIIDIIHQCQFNVKFRHDHAIVVDTKMSSSVGRYLHVINDRFHKQSGRDLTLKEIKMIIMNIHY